MTEINNILKAIDDTQANFDGTIDGAQKRMLSEVLTLSKDLTLKNGKVVASVENLKLINQIKNKLNKAVVSKEYLKDIDKLAKGFDAIQSEQMVYFSTISQGKPKAEKYNLLKQIALDNTVSQLTESGIDANVTSKVKDILLKSITSGSKYADMVGEMTNFLSDNENGQGALKRYSQTYVNTALNQYAGQNNKLMTEDLGLKWYVYRGSLRETSREFCVHLEEKEYVHESEISEIVKGNIDGFKCEIYDKTGLPKGMIDGTTESNFEVNCGGWNCNHKLIPVMDSYVPKNLRDKFAESAKEPIKYTDSQIQNAKREYYNMMKIRTLADYDVSTIGRNVAEQRMDFHNKIVSEINGGNKDLEKEWKTFFLKQEVKLDQKKAESKSKLTANKEASMDILKPIKEIKKLGDFGKWLNDPKNKYRKEYFSKKYTNESVSEFLKTII